MVFKNISTYKAKKTIKELRNNLEERTSAIASLKEELESLKQTRSFRQELTEEPQEPDSLAEAAEAEVTQSSQV